jgi:hypothetical protein
VLQFGRVRGQRERLTLDFGYPLSAVQAFAVCLASIDPKLADSKGFDAMAKLGRRMGDDDAAVAAASSASAAAAANRETLFSRDSSDQQRHK